MLSWYTEKKIGRILINYYDKDFHKNFYFKKNFYLQATAIVL